MVQLLTKQSWEICHTSAHHLLLASHLVLSTRAYTVWPFADFLISSHPLHQSSPKHTSPLLFPKHTRNASASRKLAILSPLIVPPPDICKPCSHTSFKYLISRTSNTVDKIAFRPLPPHAVHPPHPTLFCSLLFGTPWHLFFVCGFIVYCTSVEAKVSEFPVVSPAFRRLCSACMYSVSTSKVNEIHLLRF